MTSYYETSHEILISCVLSISVLTMISSSVAMVISAGFPREKLEFLRHYSVFNVVSCKIYHTSYIITCITCIQFLFQILMTYCMYLLSFSHLSPFYFPSSLVVLCIILVAGFWLAVINSLPVDEEIYRDTVRFGYAFYIYLCAGVFTLVGTCLNLLLAKTAAERRRQYRNRFRYAKCDECETNS